MGLVFEWDERYATGVPEIDAEHRHLVDIINRVFDAMSNGHSRGIKQVLDQLEAYTKGHFARELAYMRETNYPATDQHVWAHEKFSQRLARFRERQETCDPMVLMIRLAVFLDEWLHTHLLEEDRRLFMHGGSIPPPKL